MHIAQIAETFFIALIVSYSLSPFMKKIAARTGYMDHPKNNKVHAHSTPLLGGVAIFCGFTIAILTKMNLMSSGHVKAILFGTVILLIIGLIDDKMGMMPNVKLMGQFLAAIVAVKAGMRVEFLHNYYLSVIFSYVWIIGITNAFNLLDNMNGLSSGIASIAGIFLGIIAFLNGEWVVCALSFALAGASLGFLKHNFPRASMFMGDTGSLVIGYILATLSILTSWKSATWTTSIMVPLVILGYPIFDTTLVTIMRLVEGRSIFEGGKDHSSHRLALLGLKRNGAVLVIYAFCFFLGIVGIVISKTHGTNAVLVGVGAVVVMAGLGIRLSMVDTKRYGRKKGVHDL